MEFEAAGEHGQPRLIFLIHEDSVHLPPLAEPPERRARRAFRRPTLADPGAAAGQGHGPPPFVGRGASAISSVCAPAIHHLDPGVTGAAL
jgi:hypothetical protein